MAGTVLAALAAGAASNVMSEWHADEQMKRENKLMNKQNALNRANALDAYSQQVQGARMAGLSPAFLNGQSPTIAPAVTKGSVSQAENVEFDQTLGLMEAQRENVEADTAKKEAETAKISGADTKNVEADTELKTTQKLLGEANTENVKAETTRIKNINQAFAEENSAMGLFGQTMAQNWQKEPWYNKLSNGSKMVIDDIAKGNLDLTVGIASALDKSINTDQNMNETEKNKFDYELTEKVIQAQLKDPKIMKALAKFPSAQYNKLIAEASKLGVETKLLKFNYEWEKDKKDVWEHDDPDKLYAEYLKDPSDNEKAARWLVSAIRHTGGDAIKNMAPSAIHGSAIEKGLEYQGKGKLNQKKIDKAYKKVGNYQTPFDSQKGTVDFQYQLHTGGVQQMKK